MTGAIPYPSAGGSILAWARPVTEALNAPEGRAGATFRNERDRRGGIPADTRPWVFRCTIDDHDERTGGWERARLQIGYNTNVSGSSITGLDQTADGVYFVEIDLVDETAILRHTVSAVAGEGDVTEIPDQDLLHNKAYMYIGTVVDGVQTDGIYCVPVAYKYL